MLESDLGKQNPEPDGCAGARNQRLEWQKVELGSGVRKSLNITNKGGSQSDLMSKSLITRVAG
jgi:hypothetical protein